MGGYVKIAGMIDESMDTEQMKAPVKPWEFRAKPAWQRLIIMVAGVVVNFIVALIIYSMVLYTWGETYTPIEKMSYGMKFNDTAKKLGFRDGDILLGTDKTKFTSFDSAESVSDVYRALSEANKATVLRDGKEITLDVTFQEGADEIGNVEEDGTVMFYGAKLAPADRGVKIVDAGDGRLAQAGGVDGFIILYVNDQKVSKPEDVIEIAKKSRRSIFIEGVTSTGRPGYFGFGKDD